MTTLEYGPKIVNRHFDCSNNKLTTLMGATRIINGVFSCYNNRLQDLLHSPRRVADIFDCSDNELKALTGAPIFAGNNFNCSNNNIEDLNGIKNTNIIGFLILNNNNITTLEDIINNIEKAIYRDNPLPFSDNLSVEEIKDYYLKNSLKNEIIELSKDNKIKL